MSRSLGLYLEDIRASIIRVLEFTRGLKREEFEASLLVHDATLRNL